MNTTVYKIVSVNETGLWSYNCDLKGFAGYVQTETGVVPVPGIRYGIGMISTPRLEPFKLFALKDKEFAIEYLTEDTSRFPERRFALYKAEAVLSYDQNAWWMQEYAAWMEFKPHTVMCDSIELVEKIA